MSEHAAEKDAPKPICWDEDGGLYLPPEYSYIGVAMDRRDAADEMQRAFEGARRAREEHAAEVEGCDCTELCSMGPTCPGGYLARLPGAGCHRATPPRFGRHGRRCVMAIDWDSPTWGQPGHNVHIGSSDDLGKADDKHADRTEEW